MASEQRGKKKKVARKRGRGVREKRGRGSEGNGRAPHATSAPGAGVVLFAAAVGPAGARVRRSLVHAHAAVVAPLHQEAPVVRVVAGELPRESAGGWAGEGGWVIS